MLQIITICVGTNNLNVEKDIIDSIKKVFELKPAGIREMLELNKPIYEKTSAYGHFGRMAENDGSFSWEKTDKTSIFLRYFLFN